MDGAGKGPMYVEGLFHFFFPNLRTIMDSIAVISPIPLQYYNVLKVLIVPRQRDIEKWRGNSQSSGS